MKKFEYMQKTFFASLEFSSLIDNLNYFGSQGWQVVTVTNNYFIDEPQKINSMDFIFMREVI